MKKCSVDRKERETQQLAINAERNLAAAQILLQLEENSPQELKYQVAYSQHSIFFITYESAD
jgi:hypothetical protein